MAYVFCVLETILCVLFHHHDFRIPCSTEEQFLEARQGDVKAMDALGTIHVILSFIKIRSLPLLLPSIFIGFCLFVLSFVSVCLSFCLLVCPILMILFLFLFSPCFSALTCFSVMSYCRGPCNSLFLSLICLSKSSPSLPHFLLFFLHPPSFQLMLYKSLSIIPTLSVGWTPYPCLSQSI